MTNAEAKLLLFDIAGRTESQKERDALAYAIGLVSEESESQRMLGAKIHDILERDACEHTIRHLRRDSDKSETYVSEAVLAEVAEYWSQR